LADKTLKKSLFSIRLKLKRMWAKLTKDVSMFSWSAPPLQMR